MSVLIKRLSIKTEIENLSHKKELTSDDHVRLAELYRELEKLDLIVRSDAVVEWLKAPSEAPQY